MARNKSKTANGEKVYLSGAVLEGLLGVRSRLSMYLGSTGVLREGHMPRALTQMMQEVVSNSADEYLAGYGDEILVELNPDGSMSVTDHGRGIPKGPGATFDNVINMLTKTHASGKFDDSAYASVGTAGMNGIGLKAVNAGSVWLEIEACSLKTKMVKGKVASAGGHEKYRVRFKQAKVLKHEVLEANTSSKTYTKLTFMPDGGPVSDENKALVLASTKWVVGDIEPRLEACAFLMDGLKIKLVDRRGSEVYEKEWCYEHGVEDYLASRVTGSDVVSALKKPICIRESCEIDGKSFELNAAFTWTEDLGSDIESFANGVPTPEGGPHLDGFKAALTEAFGTYAEGAKTRVKSLSEADVTDGLAVVFEIRIPSDLVDFEGQTKEKLGTVEAKKAVETMIAEAMPKWFYNNEAAARALVSKMKDAQASRAAAMKARREAKAARKATGVGAKLVVSSKLKSASSKNPEEKELFIVEGDSASKIGRDPRTQAVFPLRGKILNAYRVDLSRALSNVEISTIASVIGAGVGPAFSVEDMDYHKVIICTDSDVDGAHIRMLLIGLFSKFFPGLIAAGRLYIANPPLFKATKYVKGKRQVKMFYTDEEMQRNMSKLSGWSVFRYKGLGEMSMEEAHESITDPTTRHLVRVIPAEGHVDAQALKTMLGGDAALRRGWIAQNVDFSDTAGL